MDVVFGEVSNVDGDVSIPVFSGDGRKVFKQFNNVRVEDVDQDQIVFNLQENDLSSYDEDIRGRRQGSQEGVVWQGGQGFGD